MMTNYTKKMTQQVAIPVLRESLRQQASELSGMSIEAIGRLESGEICPADDMSAYHKFFFAHIPNARELYSRFMDETLAKHGYTYDEEGNEYKDGVRTHPLDEE